MSAPDENRDIYEVANQLEGYVDESTPEHLAQFLMREGEEASKLADEIFRLRATCGWMPIETFWIDRVVFTEVLIATRSYHGGVVQVTWEPNAPHPAFMDMSGDSYFDATHWRALPKPPVQP